MYRNLTLNLNYNLYIVITLKVKNNLTRKYFYFKTTLLENSSNKV